MSRNSAYMCIYGYVHETVYMAEFRQHRQENFAAHTHTHTNALAGLSSVYVHIWVCTRDCIHGRARQHRQEKTFSQHTHTHKQTSKRTFVSLLPWTRLAPRPLYWSNHGHVSTSRRVSVPQSRSYCLPPKKQADSSSESVQLLQWNRCCMTLVLGSLYVQTL
jgi:hypothetical protein